jgi:hypothetical protein
MHLLKTPLQFGSYKAAGVSHIKRHVSASSTRSENDHKQSLEQKLETPRQSMSPAVPASWSSGPRALKIRASQLRQHRRRSQEGRRVIVIGRRRPQGTHSTAASSASSPLDSAAVADEPSLSPCGFAFAAVAGGGLLVRRLATCRFLVGVLRPLLFVASRLPWISRSWRRRHSDCSACVHLSLRLRLGRWLLISLASEGVDVCAEATESRLLLLLLLLPPLLLSPLLLLLKLLLLLPLTEITGGR